MPIDPSLQTLLDAANRARRAGRCPASEEESLERRFGCGELLAVYGTLLPGGANHGVLAGCGGNWASGEVTGFRTMRAFPVFTPDPRGPAIAVELLHSAELPGHWPMLDAFEGDEYRRVLVPVLVGGRLHRIANLYEAVEPVQGRGDATN
jgi:gamma-glutamylcyclotransferase (GGCT)/AIG2-like uncharacterized protein YtfP